MRRHHFTPLVLVCLLLPIAACAGSATGPASSGDMPPGPDTAQPFPIDRGDDGSGTPGSYKGLPLRLATNDAPAVTPVDGVIGVVCIGMSNANQECSTYIQLVEGELAGEVSERVRVVNCAVGGYAIERWIDPADDDRLWDACVRRLQQSGLRPDQVRVLYHKAANQFTTGAGGTPLPLYPAAGSDYANFLVNLSAFAARVPVEFPSVQAVYSTSRSYGGFSQTQARGEPLSYEEGHALNTWLRQNRDVSGVWYGWGPYIWAPDCITGVSNGAGMCYVRTDFVTDDGFHPSSAGRMKIARAVHARLLQHAWYRR
ncbi:hypothetical protein BH23GEM9_BH23GEM9_30140 [soil metagenome]